MEDTMPEYVGDISIRFPQRPEDVPNELEFNHSLMAQCEIDSLRSEILNLQDQRDLAMKVIERLERERDEAREELKKLEGAYEDATNYYARMIELKEERDEARGHCESIVYKANELIARWDMPSWKDTAPTARFINALRIAVEAYEKGKK